MQFLVRTRYLPIPTAQPWQRVRVRRLSDHVADCATNTAFPPRAFHVSPTETLSPI